MIRRARDTNRASGLAVVAVLLVLMALLVLLAPFLMTVSNADQSSMLHVDRATARLALDDADRHVHARLSMSHPALDSTPYWDDEEELSVPRDLDPAFLNPADPSGVMWSHEVEDVAGLIDLNSAPPQLLANLLGSSSRLGATLKKTDKEIQPGAIAGFPPAGFLWIQGELIGYGAIEDGKFTQLIRGLNVALDDEGNPEPCGPRPPQDVAQGQLILGEEALALARWRVFDPSGFRGFDSIEQVAESARLSMTGPLPPEDLAALTRAGSVFAGVGAGPRWQNGTRLTGQVDGGPIGCLLRLDDARWFNTGTTVRISDGRTTEYGIVLRTTGDGVHLTQPLVNDYAAYGAVVEPLARRPVNVNTAPPEVLHACVHGLQLAGRSTWISKREADELVNVIVQSRPFEGLEDFMTRVVLPAAGLEPLPIDAEVRPDAFADPEAGGFLDEEDAIALYKNALNANDAELAFSTMPFSFLSRDVYRMELRSSVNAKSGVERAAARREQVELIVPQRDLLHAFARQEDFEEEQRLTRRSNGWTTGPAATTRYDPLYQSQSPSRARANLGPHDTFPSSDPLSDDPAHTFAARDSEEAAYVQPWAARVEETGWRQNRMLHFDHETRDPEGRLLSDGTIRLPAGDPRVNWSDALKLMRPLTYSMWIKARSLADGERFLDVGGAYNETDRVSLLLENGDLVLRVADAAGDHPDTVFPEYGEVRYELATGDGPGMPLDTWIHVEVDVRGNRPDQMGMRVDGKYHVRTPGLTRLTSPLSSGSTTIAVETTEGFPQRCVLRIGDELIEAELAGPTSFTTSYAVTGETAGWGGRMARLELQEVAGSPPVPAGAFPNDSHPSGASVQLYGYSLSMAPNATVPSVETTMTSTLGQFNIARVPGIQKGGSVLNDIQMEPIILQGLLVPITVGFGMDGGVIGDPNDVTGLELAPCDAAVDPTEMMSAFSQTGGYAAILSGVGGGNGINLSGQAGTGGNQTLDINGTRIGGVEVIHYTGYTGNILNIDRRGDATTAELPRLKEVDQDPGYDDVWGRGSFIFHYNPSILWQVDPNTLISRQTMVIPISIPVGSTGGGVAGFPVPTSATGGNSEFAQITHVGNEAHLTEWVRYDDVTSRDLVRDDPIALQLVRNAAHGGVFGDLDGDAGPPPPTPPAPPPPGFAVGPPPSAPQSPVPGAQWQHYFGTPEDDDYPIARATRTQFSFRGVMGTFSHAHTQGTRVLPVWKTRDPGNPNGGQPGRFDAVNLFDGDTTSTGWPGIVHHAHRPINHISASYTDSGNLTAAPGPDVTTIEIGIDATVIYVGLAERMPGIVSAGTGGAIVPPGQIADPRQLGRVTAFPSGERPRNVDVVAVGGSYLSAADVPSAVVDEALFGDGEFGSSTGFGDALLGAQMLLVQDVTETDVQLQVQPKALRWASGVGGFNNEFLRDWNPDAGLMRIGDEVLCYDTLAASTGGITLPQNARGLLGTYAQPHAAGQPVNYLEHVTCAVLAGGLGETDSRIQLSTSRDFPRRGTVLIGDELIHYTWIGGNELGMPLRSRTPGAMDNRGEGLFRGRYGTTPSSHAAGTPVILFPFRYWDRWADRADAPELAYFGFELDQPDAFWRSSFFESEPSVAAGPRLGMLQRTDAATPWDADPDAVSGLEVHWDGRLGTGGNALGMQADRAEFRFFVRHEPGSFDPVNGLSHGWKTVPRLRLFGVQYLGPAAVLRRLAR
jgi:hypothetical protein